MTQKQTSAQFSQRRPKGKFAMLVAYSFTGASILASIIFSLLLFLSLDDNLDMKLLFGSLAVIFELGKFFAWYEFGERRAHGNYSGAFVAVTFYAVLAVISIGGSIGGINSATNTITQQAHLAASQTNNYDIQIAALQEQVMLNNQAAQRYIELDRLATGLTRIQSENQAIQEQILALGIKRDSLPVNRQGSVLGLIEGLAHSINTDINTAKLALVIFLSVLLDLFAAFFVGLLGEEARFRDSYLRQQANSEIHTQSSISHGTIANTPELKDEPTQPHQFEDKIVRDAVALLADGEVPCQKKALAKSLTLNQEQVDHLFTQLMDAGWVTQKPNHHYKWVGSEISAF
ncbi:Preprotein translocase subunit SecY [Thaumasiovibrio subtropicus]|uniref:Preprotein translocase subunit SecY n=1 Tax=Thaumasiovibrio subtropicus TaxID=1891207 RepID=UPI000B3593F6|nr:Preprotein translocase subunit SecY [Thaumasiovibrio subtropicus]